MKSEGEELIEELLEIVRQIRNIKSIKMLLGFAKVLMERERIWYIKDKHITTRCGLSIESIRGVMIVFPFVAFIQYSLIFI